MAPPSPQVTIIVPTCNWGAVLPFSIGRAIDGEVLRRAIAGGHRCLLRPGQLIARRRLDKGLAPAETAPGGME